EKRLAHLRDQYQQRVAQLAASFVGLPETPPETAKSSDPSKPRRGALDGPVLELLRQIAAPDASSRDIGIAWAGLNPDDVISDSTIRSVLERLHAAGHLAITDP